MNEGEVERLLLFALINSQKFFLKLPNVKFLNNNPVFV